MEHHSVEWRVVIVFAKNIFSASFQKKAEIFECFWNRFDFDVVFVQKYL